MGCVSPAWHVGNPPNARVGLCVYTLAMKGRPCRFARAAVLDHGVPRGPSTAQGGLASSMLCGREFELELAACSAKEICIS